MFLPRKSGTISKGFSIIVGQELIEESQASFCLNWNFLFKRYPPTGISPFERKLNQNKK